MWISSLIEGAKEREIKFIAQEEEEELDQKSVRPYQEKEEKEKIVTPWHDIHPAQHLVGNYCGTFLASSSSWTDTNCLSSLKLHSNWLAQERDRERNCLTNFSNHLIILDPVCSCLVEPRNNGGAEQPSRRRTRRRRE